mmetsp:Transcript_60911/g.163061  ORF Transcript_60911/g.163061 Transcript_60911/m.163061 type:complete len:226 (+) Transcript_60911:38-715(+)
MRIRVRNSPLLCRPLWMLMLLSFPARIQTVCRTGSVRLNLHSPREGILLLIFVVKLFFSDCAALQAGKLFWSHCCAQDREDASTRSRSTKEAVRGRKFRRQVQGGSAIGPPAPQGEEEGLQPNRCLPNLGGGRGSYCQRGRCRRLVRAFRTSLCILFYSPTGDPAKALWPQSCCLRIHRHGRSSDPRNARADAIFSGSVLSSWHPFTPTDICIASACNFPSLRKQ